MTTAAVRTSRRIVVTGGAGFLGSHLCQRLVDRGDRVVCVDNLSTGRMDNLKALWDRPGFLFVEADVCDGVDVAGLVHTVVHLTSPASPPQYLRLALETLAVGSRGTEAALELSDRCGARFVLGSTSEVYGDPLVHPQVEDYWGNVNPIGPRSVYDEAKRFAEAITMAYQRARATNTGIVRIFNTYGPRLQPHDGRVVSNFIAQALGNEPLTVFGDGTQTRSFCYVADLIDGLLAMIDTDEPGPVNLGHPDETSILELADLVLELTGSRSPIVFRERPEDDPSVRSPDIARAKCRLGWEPTTGLRAGLQQTIKWHLQLAVDGEVSGALLRGAVP